MRNAWWIIGLAFGGALLFSKRYKIINSLLAITLIRKMIVAIGMRLPLVREQVVSDLFQPTK
ncbi:hypothetical protein BN1058_01123 [Paraliobacillus sp. PM-2]|uniref:hypothetical protein n=1 Tax=Paraliobacillus sp. PM-2 TaxID=1462524 RepID=UPI00061C1AD4|nr:hypothetical protein [Paraliobacillus sp. PM-2]CQR46846.1 hypothetical protein BN1058_01123 [Paraliobacillus sp. PM-2]